MFRDKRDLTEIFADIKQRVLPFFPILHFLALKSAPFAYTWNCSKAYWQCLGLKKQAIKSIPTTISVACSQNCFMTVAFTHPQSPLKQRQIVGDEEEASATETCVMRELKDKLHERNLRKENGSKAKNGSKASRRTSLAGTEQVASVSSFTLDTFAIETSNLGSGVQSALLGIKDKLASWVSSLQNLMMDSDDEESNSDERAGHSSGEEYIFVSPKADGPVPTRKPRAHLHSGKRAATGTPRSHKIGTPSRGSLATLLKSPAPSASKARVPNSNVARRPLPGNASRYPGGEAGTRNSDSVTALDGGISARVNSSRTHALTADGKVYKLTQDAGRDENTLAHAPAMEPRRADGMSVKVSAISHTLCVITCVHVARSAPLCHHVCACGQERAFVSSRVCMWPGARLCDFCILSVCIVRACMCACSRSARLLCAAAKCVCTYFNMKILPLLGYSRLASHNKRHHAIAQNSACMRDACMHARMCP